MFGIVNDAAQNFSDDSVEDLLKEGFHNSANSYCKRTFSWKMAVYDIH